MTDYADALINLSVDSEHLVALLHLPGQGGVFAQVRADRLKRWRADTLDWEQATRSHSARDVGVAPVPPGSAIAGLDEFLRGTGKDLCGALFPGNAQAAWNNAFPGAGPSRIRLVFEMDPETASKVASLPLEALCCPHTGTLSRVTEVFVREDRISIVRRVSSLAAPLVGPVEVEAELRILVFACQPEGVPEDEKLDIPGEAKIVEEAAEAIGGDVKVDLVTGRKANFRALQDHDRNFDVFYCPTMGGSEALAFRRHLKVHSFGWRTTVPLLTRASTSNTILCGPRSTARQF